MKRRPIFLLLAGIMTLTACQREAQPPRQTAVSTPSPTPIATPEPVPAPLTQAADVPPGDYAPWQEAYAGFLEALRQKEAVLADRVKNAGSQEMEEDGELWAAYGDSSASYALYDADEDGTPELFVQYGMAEAGSHTVCYTFRDGVVRALENGDFPSGHGSIYTCPGQSAFLFCWGHMGYAQISRVPVEAGGLGQWELLLDEDVNPSANGGVERDYTDPATLVPGAEPVSYYDTATQWQTVEVPALVLPIYDYGKPPRQAENGLEEAEIRKLPGEVLGGKREFTGVSGDNFYGNTGSVTWEEYLQPGGAYPYNKTPLIPREVAFADVNGDGQTDCIIKLEQPTEGFEDHSLYTVLSLEDGRVYAYLFGFADAFGVDPNGSVFLRDMNRWYQVSFYKNQCYKALSPSDPVEGCDLAWEPMKEADFH